MNASKAKRRWMRWCRYVDKTQSQSAGKWYGGLHRGHGNAYTDLTQAGRAYPHGLRAPWYPRWGVVKR